MSLLNLLFSRSAHDQAVELFLREVFLHVSSHMKTLRLVSKEWNDFIRLKIWENKRVKHVLLNILLKSLKSQTPARTINMFEKISWVTNFPPSIPRILCDDEILILSEEETDVKRIHLFSLVTLNECESLELDKENYSVNEIRFSIAPSYFCTILTCDKWLRVWSKSGTLIDSIIIGQNLGYLRLLKAVRSMIFVVEVDRSKDNSRVFIFKFSEESLNLTKTNNSFLEHEIPRITRAIESNGQDVFYTAHENFVDMWEIDKQYPIKTLHTGLVVDMVLNERYLVTIGSAQNPGVHIWDVGSGAELKTLSLSDTLMSTSFERITLGVNQILLDGYRRFLLLYNSDKSEFAHIELGAQSCQSMLAMGKTKFVTFFPTNLTDKDKPTLTISDYWNNF